MLYLTIKSECLWWILANAFLKCFCLIIKIIIILGLCQTFSNGPNSETSFDWHFGEADRGHSNSCLQGRSMLALFGILSLPDTPHLIVIEV